MDEGPLFTFGDLFFWLYLYPLPKIAGILPARALDWIAGLGDPLMQFQARHKKARARRWMVACGCASRSGAGKIARQSVSRQLSGYLNDLMLLSPRRAKALECTGIDGAEHYERARAQQKGVILISGHFACGRAAASYLTRRGDAILAVHNQLSPNRNGGRLGRALMPRFTELRRRAYPNVVYIQDPQCSLKILKTLRCGGSVKIQIDGAAGTKYIECTFLGAPWRMPVGIFDLIRISGCAVVPMMATGNGRSFRILFEEPLSIQHGGSREEFIAANWPILLGAIEKQILDHPEEWTLWTNK